MQSLKSRWYHCFEALALPQPPEVAFKDICRRYNEPHRAYHTLQHIEECFAQLDRVRDLAENPGEIGLAVWFHDAIYDTHAKDNEERSAELAADLLTGLVAASAQIDRVRELILATRHDAAPVEPDAQLLVDIDLSILGAAEPRFDAYERQVRREYIWVEDALFRKTRAGVLKGFLERGPIYSTDYFWHALEHAARANLMRSIETLER